MQGRLRVPVFLWPALAEAGEYDQRQRAADEGGEALGPGEHDGERRDLFFGHAGDPFFCYLTAVFLNRMKNEEIGRWKGAFIFASTKGCGWLTVAFYDVIISFIQ